MVTTVLTDPIHRFEHTLIVDLIRRAQRIRVLGHLPLTGKHYAGGIVTICQNCQLCRLAMIAAFGRRFGRFQADCGPTAHAHPFARFGAAWV